jgi:2-polyprenyl-3-methyl-5-hydroxy-6-metoxy-1,4-benzoquinol methylase
VGKVTILACECAICGYKTVSPHPEDLGRVRGNTERFKSSLFHLWKCPQCKTIHSIDPVDFQDIYSDYPLNKRRLDIYARGTLGNLLKRLRRAGLGKTDAILDYGCGNGLFVKFLKSKGYIDVRGYDPYVSEFINLQEEALFDCIVANDVIEHVENPRDLIRDCIKRLRAGGLLYIGTADSEGVDMNNLEPHIMRLHQPFHRIIISQETLKTLGEETGLELVAIYRRSYMDTLIPFANYRFLDEFSKALGHDMNKALDPAAGLIVLRRPILLFWGCLGYFFPSACEPAVVLRKGG